MADEQPVDAMALAIPHEYELAVQAWFSDAVHELARSVEPLLRDIPITPSADLPDDLTHTATADERRSDLFNSITITHDSTMSLDVVREFDLGAFAALVDEAAGSFSKQLVAGMVAHIGAVAQDHGNSFNVGDEDFYETFLEAAENIEWGFDGEGRSTMMLIVTPDFEERVAANPPTADQERRMVEIENRKRREFFASRHRRPLP